MSCSPRVWFLVRVVALAVVLMAAPVLWPPVLAGLISAAAVAVAFLLPDPGQ